MAKCLVCNKYVKEQRDEVEVYIPLTCEKEECKRIYNSDLGKLDYPSIMGFAGLWENNYA